MKQKKHDARKNSQSNFRPGVSVKADKAIRQGLKSPEHSALKMQN